MISAESDKLFTGRFSLIFLVSVAISTSFYMLLPTLPVYVLKQLGGREADVGLLMVVLALSSVPTYPFAGRQADRRGRKIVLVLGLVGFAVSAVLYKMATTIPLLLALRVLHGVVWAATIASVGTIFTDLAPAKRRGEAVGYFGMSANIAMSFGPALGMALIAAYDFGVLFLACAALAILALAVSLAIPETRLKRPRTELPRTESSSAPVARPRLSRRALFPPVIMFFVTIGYGAVVSFLPIYALSQGVDNPGLFFTAFAIVLILVRTFIGRLADRFGRQAVVVPGMCFLFAGMAVLSTSGTLPAILAVAVLYGAGFACAHSGLMALTVDRVDAVNRGTAVGYFSAAFDLGIGIGSLLMGFIVHFVGYPNMFLAAGLIALVGLAVFVLGERRLKAAGRGAGAVSEIQ